MSGCRHTKLEIYNSEVIIYSYEYISRTVCNKNDFTLIKTLSLAAWVQWAPELEILKIKRNK